MWFCSYEERLQKLKEQLGDAKISASDPTQRLTKKFQATLRQMRKDNKIDSKLFYEMYPSDAVPPRMYGMVKAHKPQKNFPMRAVVSTIGTPMYGTSKFLVKLIQPTLDKNETRLRNSHAFVEQATLWEINPNETQVSFDVVALYPSVPIRKAIPAIMDLLQSDFESVSSQTKMDLSDIKVLLELCLGVCYFLFEDNIYTIDDAGPIGLSLMVVIAEGYLQTIESKALRNAIANGCGPLSYLRYVDDSHSRFRLEPQVDGFLHELNEQDPQIQYTVDREENGRLPFLDVEVINNRNGKYDFKVYRKSAITNVQLKPHSSINPNIFNSVFKGFLVRATRICSAEYLDEELQFLIDIFTENGYNRTMLEDMVRRHKNPVTPNTTLQNEVFRRHVKIPWIPKIGPKLRKIFRRQGIKVFFSSSQSLSDILCNHKCQLPKNSRPGVYKVPCKCGKASYVGETKKRISSRVEEHAKDVFHGRWESSGLAQHAKSCKEEFDFEAAKTLAVDDNMFLRRTRESLEIRRHETAPGMFCASNRDRGRLKTESWNALLKKMKVVEQT